MPSLLLAAGAALALLRLQDPAPEAPPAAPAAPLASALIVPLYLDEAPPPVRSLRLIHLAYAGSEGAPHDVTRTREETLELAQHLITLLRAGGSFEDLCREYSAAKNAGTGGIMGTFTPGLLAPPMDAFLYSAEVGDVSAPIPMSNGILVLQRIETLAATRHILVRGKNEAEKQEVESLKARALAGEDFGALARESSDDGISAPRGGLFTLFERGPADRLLKEAAFRSKVGDVAGPIETPVGYHLIQRVPLEGHPEDLREVTMVRLRAILISHDNTPLGGITAARSLQDAERLARELHARIRGGEDMAALARETNDDIGGKERAGDLGWVHRGNPRSAQFLDAAFAAEPGELLDPILTNAGWVVLRRER